MTPTQRKAMQRAVSACELLLPTLPGLNDKGQRWLRNELIAAMDDLNNALKGDNEVIFDKAEQADFEKWLADTCPSGDSESVNRQWDAHKERHYTAAPPSQTPPRLTDEQISEIAVNNPPNVHTYGRAIETAVRAQFGVNDE